MGDLKILKPLTRFALICAVSLWAMLQAGCPSREEKSGMTELPLPTPIAMHPLSESAVVSGTTAFGISLLREFVSDLKVEGDFTRVSNRLKDTAIKAVVHKTFLRVDEKGSEAAAATIMTAAAGPDPPEPKEKPRPFVVNRPFLCAIVHDATGTVLFLGVINDPKITQ